MDILLSPEYQFNSRNLWGEMLHLQQNPFTEKWNGESVFTAIFVDKPFGDKLFQECPYDTCTCSADTLHEFSGKKPLNNC